MFVQPPATSNEHWVYDDPSGLPEPELTISLPTPLHRSIEVAASDAGVTPRAWLAQLVLQGLRPTTLRAL